MTFVVKFCGSAKLPDCIASYANYVSIKLFKTWALVIEMAQSIKVPGIQA